MGLVAEEHSGGVLPRLAGGRVWEKIRSRWALLSGSVVCAAGAVPEGPRFPMTTAIAPSPVTTHVAVLTPDERAFHWLASLVSSSPRHRYTPVWRRGINELRAGEAEVAIVDLRTQPAPWQALRLDGIAVVCVVPDGREDVQSDDEPGVEWLTESQLNAANLELAVRRARQMSKLQSELQTLRQEAETRAQAQERANRERARHERLLQGILENLPIILGRVERDGRVVETHGAGLTRCGLSPADLQNRLLTDALPQAGACLRQALDGETCTFSARGRHLKSEWHADFVLMPDGAPEGGAIFLGRDVSERRWLEQQLLTATDAEQQRIGADLHDGLGQQLTGLACLVAGLRDRLRTRHELELAGQADFVVQVANDATRLSRALARGLCPVQLEGASLQSALQDLAHQAEQLHGIHCRFQARGMLPPLDHLTAIHLYHICQEALHNAVRHGSARNVRFMLVSRGARHRLTIVDDGCGFDLQRKPASASRGLRLMNYRAGMIGGTLSITSWPGRGTRVRCQFTHASPPP